MKLLEIHAGLFKLDGGAMFGVVPKSIWSKLVPPDERNLCTWAMRLLLIDTGDRKVLVDTGMGSKQSEKFFGYYEPHGPTLEDSLRSAGYGLEDITDVFLTHLHFDHVGGAISKSQDGEALLPTFPNALYWSNGAHWDAALSPNARERASFLEENILPIQQSGRLRLLDGPGQWIPGIDVEFVYGHTEAQMLPVVRMDNGEKLYYMADLCPSVHHLKASYVIGYDIRPLDTMEERSKILGKAHKEHALVMFEHGVDVAACRLDFDGRNYTSAINYACLGDALKG